MPRADPPPLPPAVRDRVLALAADRLGALPPEQVPAGLRAFARFTPVKRARLAAVPLALALEADDGFREQVAEGLREALPDLVAALQDGTPLPLVPPEDQAAAAYLLRPQGWQQQVQAVADRLATQSREQVGAAAGAAAGEAVRRLTEQLAAERTTARAEASRLRGEAEAARAEAAAVRKRVRELGDRAGRAEAAARAAEQGLADERVALQQAREQVDEQDRALQARLAAVEQAADSARAGARAEARAGAREGRQADELRLRVLLDALLGAATGLRRELALAPLDGRPADAVAADYTPAPQGGPTPQGRAADDPLVLDALLQVAMTHLLVDGYNVTKTGYGDLTLEAQRTRLLAGLGALAARTGAETTAVFDGAERPTPSDLAAPRGVRLLFSRPGETADDVLRRLVRLEPPGRPLVVVTSDREVADATRADGARTAPSIALVRLLDRPR